MKKGWRIAMWVSLFIAGFLLMGLVVQSLWNWLLPEIMGWKAINYWQAMGLLVLSKILFKGFFWNGGRWGNGKWSNHHWSSKWQAMSPEDREKFKQKMRERCSWTSASEPKETNIQ